MVENAHKYGIMRMGIFGSVARGEQTEDSDVDVCVELLTAMRKQSVAHPQSVCPLLKHEFETEVTGQTVAFPQP